MLALKVDAGAAALVASFEQLVDGLGVRDGVRRSAVRALEKAKERSPRHRCWALGNTVSAGGSDDTSVV